MTNTNIFEIAVRSKFRFPFKGMITVEDLFDLNVTNLDQIFKMLNSQLKQVKEESLLNTKTKEDKELDVKIEIVKYIVGEKLAEQEQRVKAREQREQRQRILEILANKENEALQGKSIDELKAMLADVEN